MKSARASVVLIVCPRKVCTIAHLYIGYVCVYEYAFVCVCVCACNNNNNNNNNNNKIIYSFKRKGDVSLIRRFKTPHNDEIKYQERKNEM